MIELTDANIHGIIHNRNTSFASVKILYMSALYKFISVTFEI